MSPHLSEALPVPRLVKKPSKPKPNYAWFERMLRDNQLSQRELARRLHLDAGGLNRRLKGRMRLKLEEAASIALLLNSTVEDVLTNAGVRVPETTTPKGGNVVALVGWVDGTMSVHLQRVPGAKTVAAPPVPIAGLKALRFQTAMSAVDELDGAVAYYRPEPGVNKDAIGKQCVVTLESGETVLRVLRPGYQRGRYNLLNRATGQIESDVIVESAARIVWLQM